VTRRLLALAAIVGIGPLAILVAWPWVAGQLRTAELNVALLTGAREEIFVTGSLHDRDTAAFSLQTLSIEEPGKEPYRRPISLDAERRFELALGQPREGAYRVALRTRQADAKAGAQERWLRAPDLTIAEGGPLVPRKVSSQEISYRGLLLVAALVLAAQAALLALWFRLSSRGRKLPHSSEVPAVDHAAAG